MFDAIDANRWIKFEEDVEEGGNRWSKPHVATLSLHSLFELRSCLMNGCVMLDIEASEFSQIIDMMLDKMMAAKSLEEHNRDPVREALLKRHTHQFEYSKGTVHRDASQPSGFLQTVRSIADIGRNLSHARNLQQHDAEGIAMPKLTRNWIDIGRFKDKAEADHSLDSQGVAKEPFRRKSNDNGNVWTYRCANMRKFKCPFEVRLFFPAETSDIIVQSAGAHMHEDHSSGPFTPEQADVIDRCMQAAMKPHQIKRSLDVGQVVYPKRKDEEGLKFTKALYNKIQRTKRKDRGGPVEKWHSGSLAEWCEQHLFNAALDPTELFIVSDYNTDPQNIYLFMTTKAMLETCMGASVLQTDGTYKLLFQKYVCIVLGTSDANRHFHPVGFCVINGETEADYTRVFNSLKQALRSVHNFDFAPKYCMADGAKAITGAIKAAFPSSIRLMCWKHMETACQRNQKKLPDGSWPEAYRDITNCHFAPNDRIFVAAVTQMLQKWNQKPGWQEFAEYFRSTWLTDERNWFCGAAEVTANTNNGLESLNARIKQMHTYRKEMCMPDFMKMCEKMLEEWTETSSLFSFLPSIDSTKHMTDAWQWEQLKREVVPILDTTTNSYHFFVASKTCRMSVNDYVSLLGSANFINLEHYSAWLYSWFVVKDITGSGYFTCSCPIGMRDYVCKHSTGIRIRYMGLDVPQTARALPFGRRGRGNPKKVSKALHK